MADTRGRATRPYARTACQRCRRHRKKCDGKTPCSRCVRAGVTCEVMDALGRMDRHAPPPAPVQEAAAPVYVHVPPPAQPPAPATRAAGGAMPPAVAAEFASVAETLRALQSTVASVAAAVHKPAAGPVAAPASLSHERTVDDVRDVAFVPLEECLGRLDLTLTMKVARVDEAVARTMFACAASELEGRQICDDIFSTDGTLAEGFAETEVVLSPHIVRMQGGWERSYSFNKLGEPVLSMCRFSMLLSETPLAVDSDVVTGNIIIKWARRLPAMPPMQFYRWGLSMYPLVDRVLARCRRDYPEGARRVVLIKADNVVRYVLAEAREGEEHYWEAVDMATERRRALAMWSGGALGTSTTGDRGSGTPLSMRVGDMAQHVWEWDTMPSWGPE